MNYTTIAQVEAILCQQVAHILKISPDALNSTMSVGEIGLDSLGYVQMSTFIQQQFDQQIEPDALYGHMSIGATAENIFAALSGVPLVDTPAETTAQSPKQGEADIAVIGCGFKLPGADNLSQLHQLIHSGTTHFDKAPVYRWDESGASYLPDHLTAGLMTKVDRFDAQFFDISHREAITMDPQQRLLLQAAWQTLQSSGYSRKSLTGSDTAVFVGASSFDYLNLLERSGIGRSSHIGTGISHAILANRLSYYFDWQGASETIDTACSSSLVALWRGVETLRRGESQMTLVGGVNLLAAEKPFAAFSEAGMLSDDGHCRVFDKEASGYVRGEGVGCVLLKPLGQAQLDGDNILAVIKGGAVRHSGRTQSLTAPNPNAQIRLLRLALQNARLAATDIDYIEAHGTGTVLGDPIEIRAIKQVYGSSERHPCYISSIKMQIGHLEAAAGMAGLLKALTILNNDSVPGNKQVSQLNPLINLEGTGLVINHQTQPWPGKGDKPRRVAVSSFGFGGVNAQIILEQAPVPPAGAMDFQSHLILCSGKTVDALNSLCRQWLAFVDEQQFEGLLDEQKFLKQLAFSLRRGFADESHRLAFSATSIAELINGLSRKEVLKSARLPHHNETQLWLSGEAIDWCKLIPRRDAIALALPSSHFDSHADSRSFWPITLNDRQTSNIDYWQQQWQPSVLADSQQTLPAAHLLIIIDGTQGLAVAKELGQQWPDSQRILLQFDQDPAQATLALEQAGDRQPIFVDLTALDDYGAFGNATQAAARLGYLSALLGPILKQGEAVGVVQVTSQLQSTMQSSGIDVDIQMPAALNLSGAALNGWYQSLSAEYKNCRSLSLDVSQEESAAYIASRILAELSSGDDTNQETAVLYRGQQRWCQQQTPVRLDNTALVMADKNVMITGASGALGQQLAIYLAKEGIKSILLCGRKSIDPPLQAFIDKIRSKNVFIKYYRGNLMDQLALEQELATFEDAAGTVELVFHCAGAVDKQTPAFYKKSSLSMSKVFEPKVASLLTLHKVFEQRPPQALVLFSSISAVNPAAAAGVLDYASANHFMDLFAQYQHSRGCHFYQSIQWDRWQGDGMGQHIHSSDSGLTPEDALQAMAHCMSALKQLPVVAIQSNRPPAATKQSINKMATATLGKAVTMEELLPRLTELLAEELETDIESLGPEESFDELGVDSIILIGLITALEKWLGHHIEPQVLMECDSINEIAQYLVKNNLADNTQTEADMTVKVEKQATDQPATQVPTQSGGKGKFPVAVIGMSCRFPGADSLQGFWQNLHDGKDCITTIPTERWSISQYFSEHKTSNKSYSQYGGFINNIDVIYPKLFGIKASEAADVDPLIRLFTECSLAAIANTAGGIEGLKNTRTGVFVGSRTGSYSQRIEVPGKNSISGVGQNFIGAHISQLLNLKGPNMTLDSACSSSLASIHMACQSLYTNDSDIALAGGVDVLLDEKPYLFLSASQALSPDGRCRSFAADANGFVPGEGAGCVVLKPLAQAQQDGDPIYAVIEGSAINNDGKTLGITTPGTDGQEDVIKRALVNAELKPADISYVETHGTGTLIGDPIELQSLSRALQSEQLAHTCALGSVKSNIGHLLSAAGVASFIKVALTLHHQTLVQTLHCATLNPRFDFARYSLQPVQQTRPWQSDSRRYAGISAFGFGKTNVHMVLGEKPADAGIPSLASSQIPAHMLGEPIRALHPSTATLVPEVEITPKIEPVVLSSAKQPGQLLQLESVIIED
jgi:acyl transferase domain-containing protein/acyl carrier protein